MRPLRIGAGAGFSGDRIGPAIDLAERGELDYLVFECLAERTIALAQLSRLHDPRAGYDPHLERRIRAVLPACVANGTRIVSNMGAANPAAAARRIREIACEMGFGQLKVAAVTGDDVLAMVGDRVLTETGMTAGVLGDRLASANAYIGVEGIIEALAQGADVVICGRASDPALFLAPIMFHFGWRRDDYERLGRGTLVGHLLECTAHVTGGYFADPGVKDVPDLANLGFPLAEVAEDGNAVITKLAGTGGMVDRRTCTEQLLYEIHDPARYLQPDVIADFSQVRIDEVGPDRVAVSGATGHAPTGELKVSVGYRDGWMADAQILYAGANCVARARLAAEVLRSWLAAFGNDILEDRVDLIGLDSLAPGHAGAPGQPSEIRMRYAARCATREVADRILLEFEGLYLSGPAGGGGVSMLVKEILGVASTYIPAAAITPSVHLLEAKNEAA